MQAFKKLLAAIAGPAPAADALPLEVESPPGPELSPSELLPLPKFQDYDNRNVAAGPHFPLIQDTGELGKKVSLVPFKLHGLPNFKLRDAIASSKPWLTTRTGHACFMESTNGSGTFA